MIFHCVEILQCVYPFITDEHLGSFKLWGSMNKAAMGILYMLFFVPMYTFLMARNLRVETSHLCMPCFRRQFSEVVALICITQLGETPISVGMPSIP